MVGTERQLRARLRRPDFLLATRRGRRIVTRYFLVFQLERKDAGETRLGITVTRKVGHAVRRNRIKRLVREWFRKRELDFGSCDLVLVAKRDMPQKLHQDQINADLNKKLREIGVLS